MSPVAISIALSVLSHAQVSTLDDIYAMIASESETTNLAHFDTASLLEHGFATRKLRAYAYLTASLNASQNAASDIVDCLLPFVAAGVKEQAGQFLELDRLKTYLEVLGLRVPLYTLQQLMPRLQDMGVIEWNTSAHRHICKQTAIADVLTLRNDAGLEDAFATFEDEFSAYAFALGLTQPPMSASWSDALIGFLRSDPGTPVIRTTSIKETLVGDTSGVETYLVARFIQEVQGKNATTFGAIIQIFTGVLIEDFINNIQAIGDTKKYGQLSIYYDTTVLLRLLGTSGSMLLTATMEMHRALEDLGCKCFYLQYTLDEVSRILDTIVSNHDAGDEIYGETSDAISNAEITIGTIRDIRTTFEQRLGELNIFPQDYVHQARRNEDVYQIDEASLVTGIEAEAMKRGRQYKHTSAVTDAKSVAIVMRLRKGLARRNIQACEHLFISHNAVFQTAARTFVARNVEGYDGGQIPPVLTLGQITTVAWLATAQKLDPVKVTKELLATCYNAVRPSVSWTQQFSLALESFRNQNPGFIEERANAALFLQIARNSARDESLNQPAVLRKANLAAIFASAAEEADAKERERAQEVARLTGEYEARDLRREEEIRVRQARLAQETQQLIDRAAKQAREQKEEIERQHELDKQAGIRAATEEAAHRVVTEQRDATRRHRVHQSALSARVATNILRIAVSVALAYLLFLLSVDYWAPGTAAKIVAAAVISILLVLANMDLFGMKVVKIPAIAFEKWLDGQFLGLLTKLDPPTGDRHGRIEPIVDFSKHEQN
jgi:hypothetical protein